MSSGRSFMLAHCALFTICVLLLFAAADAALAQPFGLSRGAAPPQIGAFAGWVLSKQAEFYRMLSGTIRAAKSDGSAAWTLMGISFAYGIFHAAGPGHGKAVISSYLVANDETWRRGIALSFASAVLQAFTAIAIVGIAAVLLNATAHVMGQTVRVIEIVSYALIVLIGLRLLWVKGRAFLKLLLPQGHGHHDHAHGHDHGHDHGHAHAHEHSHHHDHHHSHEHDHGDEAHAWGHAHAPEPSELTGKHWLRRGLSAIVAVGLRPCSGAIIVLVFALAQGLFWIGVASTFVMGLGTAITVGGVATLAVAAKTLAKRVARKPTGSGGVLMRGVEFGAAGLVLTFGILLLTGYMASERMGLF
ncbi:MAG: nickel/cobalt transporter [Pseudolabrys sp.]